MAKAAVKTERNDASVADFLDAVEHPTRREDARAVCALMERVTGEKPAMWGTSIVGFGSYRYRYKSGRESEWMTVGFSPRKANLVLYIMSDFATHPALMAKLGKHKIGKSCLYLTRLADVDLAVLEQLIRESVAHVRRREADENGTA